METGTSVHAWDRGASPLPDSLPVYWLMPWGEMGLSGTRRGTGTHKLDLSVLILGEQVYNTAAVGSRVRRSRPLGFVSSSRTVTSLATA